MVTESSREEPVMPQSNLQLHGGDSSEGVAAAPMRSFGARVLKRSMDIALSLPVVIFVLPPVAAIAWGAQRLQSPGPVFFRQERCGIGKKRFTILKLRTMDHAEDSLAGDAEARIFPIGGLLRKTKLDEIPQFVNVLTGAMSIVGPRPHHFEDCANFESEFKDYAWRTVAKPGITGLAQYKEYRGDFEWNCVENRVKRDLIYIRQWSLLLDVRLIFKTANVIFRKSRHGLVKRLEYRVEKPAIGLTVFRENEPDQSVAASEAQMSETQRTPRKAA